MTTAPLHTCGAASPTRTRRCSRNICTGALLLGLQLAASAPPAAADVDVDRLVFEARLLEDAPLPAFPAAAAPAPAFPAPAATLAAGTAEDTPQLPATDSLLAQIAAHNRRIAAWEEAGGAFAPQLVQEYLDLGRRYQSLGRHEAAIEAFEDAEHLNRISEGLVNPALLTIIEASLPSHLALGELQELGHKQQTLYELTREQYGSGSAELVPILARLGDWQVASFRRSLQSGPVVSIAFGGGGSIDPRRAGFMNLSRAQRHYAEAVGNVLQRQDLHADELMLLEQKFVQTMYLEANRLGLLDDPDFFLDGRRTTTGSRIQHSEMQGFTASFINGRSAYQRMQFYARHRQEPADVQAGLLVAEADWHLLFRHHGTARRLYEEARALLLASGLPEEAATARLSPFLPPQLPEFLALPHSRGHYGLPADAPLQWEGWIDVSFGLTRFGKPDNLKVLGSSPGTDKAVQGRLRRLLLSSPFRPPTGPAGAAQVYRLRYHYALVDAGLAAP